MYGYQTGTEKQKCVTWMMHEVLSGTEEIALFGRVARVKVVLGLVVKVGTGTGMGMGLGSGISSQRQATVRGKWLHKLYSYLKVQVAMVSNLAKGNHEKHWHLGYGKEWHGVHGARKVAQHYNVLDMNKTTA